MTLRVQHQQHYRVWFLEDSIRMWRRLIRSFRGKSVNTTMAEPLNWEIRHTCNVLSDTVARIEEREEESQRHFAFRTMQRFDPDFDPHRDLDASTRRSAVTPYLAANEFCEKPKLKARHLKRLEMIGTALNTGRCSAPIDTKYMKHLAAMIGLRKPSDAPSFVRFCDHIPEALLWDFSFGARATTSYSKYRFPVLETYKPYIGTIEYIARPFAFSIVEPTSAEALNNVHLGCSEKELLSMKPSDASKYPYLHAAFAKCLRDLADLPSGSFHWAHMQKDLTSASWSDPILGAAEAVEIGALAFAELHEIGHIVQGHLDLSWSQDFEFDADRFAIEILSLCNVTTSFRSLMFSGVELSFGFLLALALLAHNIERYESLLQRLASVNQVIGECVGAVGYYHEYAPERDAAALIIEGVLLDPAFLDQVRTADGQELTRWAGYPGRD